MRRHPETSGRGMTAPSLCFRAGRANVFCKGPDGRFASRLLPGARVLAAPPSRGRSAGFPESVPGLCEPPRWRESPPHPCHPVNSALTPQVQVNWTPQRRRQGDKRQDSWFIARSGRFQLFTHTIQHFINARCHHWVGKSDHWRSVILTGILLFQSHQCALCPGPSSGTCSGSCPRV